uniref:Uncharacterized protein n=1 Tax=Anguilla anguilla TaxID=7936 RepID=A0A0E9QDD5_ANGAN
MMSGLLAARLRLEFVYYKLTDNMDAFMHTWGIGGVLCTVQEDLLLLHFCMLYGSYFLLYGNFCVLVVIFEM